MGEKSFARVVFGPLDRLADALHPYRWHFVLVALSATAAFLGLAYAGEEYWPEQSSRVLVYAFPIVVHLAAWGWGARFLVAWYGTRPRGPRFLHRIPQELLDPFAPIKRVWHLLVLAFLLLVPCLVWFALYVVYVR